MQDACILEICKFIAHPPQSLFCFQYIPAFGHNNNLNCGHPFLLIPFAMELQRTYNVAASVKDLDQAENSLVENQFVLIFLDVQLDHPHACPCTLKQPLPESFCGEEGGYQGRCITPPGVNNRCWGVRAWLGWGGWDACSLLHTFNQVAQSSGWAGQGTF